MLSVRSATQHAAAGSGNEFPEPRLRGREGLLVEHGDHVWVQLVHLVRREFATPELRSGRIFDQEGALRTVLKIDAVLRNAEHPPYPDMTRHVTSAGGNIFADLGFGAGEAEALRIRSTLIAAIRRLIRESGLTRTAAAALLGTTEGRVSEMMDGRINDFTIDTLAQMLARAGFRVEVRVLEAA